MTFEDEMDTFMKGRIEQSHAWNDFHSRGTITQEDLARVVAHTVGVHREAILRVAREIDNITGRK
jgi:hypothetical protein